MTHASRDLDAYLGEVQRFWPESDAPRLQRGRGQDRSCYAFLVVPSPSRPRLLLPAGNAAAAARAMLRFSSALSPRDTATRLAVSMALRAHVRPALPHRILVPDHGDSLRAHLSDRLGEPVDFSLGLGTVRVNRKPVLQVFDRRGRVLAFAKVGTSDVSRGDVGGEVAALRRLGAADLPARLEVPRLLDESTWRGLLVAVMTPLHTTLWQRPARLWELPLALMTGFAESFGEGERPLDELPLWEWLTRTPSRLPREADRFAAALDQLQTRATGPLPSGAWHGDWTPWNQSRGRGRLQLWDWERFETGVPVGLDRCHYGVQAVTRRDGMRVRPVLDGLRHAGLDAADRVDRLLGGVYLATIAARYLRSAAAGDEGAVVAPSGLVMLDALTVWLSAESGLS